MTVDPSKGLGAEPQPAAALLSIIVPRNVGGLGTWEPPTQLAGVEFESPQPPPGGVKELSLFPVAPPDVPLRARRARIRKLLMVTKPDLIPSPLRVASRFVFSFCFIFPSPLHSHPLTRGILCVAS